MSQERAIITGASSGIGAALARRLAEAGYDLLLVARRVDRLEVLAADLRARHGRDVRVLALDVTRDDVADVLADAAPDATVLVNNAGAGRFGRALDVPIEEQAQVVRLNCESLTRLSLRFLRLFAQRRAGVILNVASIAAFQPVPYFAVYAASKAYVLSLSEALDHEGRASGVRVVAVCPGPVPTEFQSIAGSPDAMETGGLARRSPEQVAEACLRALRDPRPVVTPAPIHALMHWGQRLLPRSAVVGMAGRGMLARIRRLGGG